MVSNDDLIPKAQTNFKVKSLPSLSPRTSTIDKLKLDSQPKNILYLPTEVHPPTLCLPSLQDQRRRPNESTISQTPPDFDLTSHIYNVAVRAPKVMSTTGRPPFISITIIRKSNLKMTSSARRCRFQSNSVKWSEYYMERIQVPNYVYSCRKEPRHWVKISTLSFQIVK